MTSTFHIGTLTWPAQRTPYISIGRAGGQPDPGSSSFSLSVPAPTPLTAGDFLLQMVGLDGNTNPYSGLASSGWTLATSSYDPGNLAGGGVLWKIAGSSEPSSYTDTATGLNLWAAVDDINYRGPTGIDAASITGSTTSTGPAVAPSVTSSGPNRVLVCSFILWQLAINQPPSGMIQRDNSASVYGSIAIATYDQIVDAGATGARSATLTAQGGTARWAAISVLLK